MMTGMVSSGTRGRVRKEPEERRAEILSTAATIALEDGLERITLRAVAERLGVRPGLISHYFPAAEDLVIAAFELAIAGERQEMFEASGPALDRMAGIVHRIESRSADDLARLWLNARHLSRFSEPLTRAVEAQEAHDRDELIALIEQGVAEGSFVAPDPLAACIRIFMAIDGFGGYVNDRGPFVGEAFTGFVSDVVAWSLGFDRTELDAAVARLA